MPSSASQDSRPPAFQFYPKDFLTDSNVVVMSLHERGAYITLICQCWIEGSIPSDLARLARLCGIPLTAFRKLWPAILPCFRSKDEDRFVHPRLEKERKKQLAWKAEQSEHGKKGAGKRWGRHSEPIATPSKINGHPIASPMGSPMPKHASLSLSSSSSSDLRQKNVRAREEHDDLGERAGRFLERYSVLYEKHRKGARYVGRPALDFQEAMQLCRTWDDERLDKIAVVFLTTDHDFAEKGSRTVAQFRSMASWCDGKLAEAGIA